MIVRITVNVLLMKRQREKLFNKIKGGKKWNIRFLKKDILFL
jgi:hypothetical protein